MSMGLSLGLGLGSQGGAPATVQDVTANALANYIGSVYTLTTAFVTPPITWSKVSGDANLSVVNGLIVTTAGIALAASQSIIVRAQDATNTYAVEFQVTLTGAYTIDAQVKVASFQNHVPNTLGTITFTKYASRKIDVLPKAMQYVQAEFNNWILPAGSTSLASDNTNSMVLTNLYASCNGVVVQATFAGSTTRTIATGEDKVRCDPLSAKQFGYTTEIFPEGAIINWTTEFTQPTTGHKFPYTAGLSFTTTYGGGGDKSITWNPAATTVTLNNVGTITSTGTTPTSAAGGIGYVPITVGVPVETDVQPIVVRGNSQSQNETSWIQQAVYSLNWPCLNLAVSSSKIQAGIDDSRVQRMYGLGKQGIIQFGRNEFPAMSVATLQGYVAQDAAVMRAKGVTRIGCDDVPPYTSSTDSWATAANQTQQAGSGSGSNDDLFSQSITSITGIDYKTTRNNNRAGGDFFKWVTNGSANYPTTDGKHSTVALETLKSTECVPLIGSAAQIAKANAEALVLIAEGPGSAAQKAAAQTAVNTASGLGADVTRLQARLDAITITVFSDPMGAIYAANSDVPTANPLWIPDAAYVTGALLYTGGANGIKQNNAAGGFIVAPQQGNTVQQRIMFTSRNATLSALILAVLWLDKDNWIGITNLGVTALTLTTVSIRQAGVTTTLSNFTNATNSATADIYDLRINGTTLELRQNGTLLVPVTTGADNISSQLSGFLSTARKSAIGCRSATTSAAVITWSNRNVV